MPDAPQETSAPLLTPPIAPPRLSPIAYNLEAAVPPGRLPESAFAPSLTMGMVGQGVFFFSGATRGRAQTGRADHEHEEGERPEPEHLRSGPDPGGPGAPAMRNREEEAEVMPRRVGLVRADQAIQ